MRKLAFTLDGDPAQAYPGPMQNAALKTHRTFWGSLPSGLEEEAPACR